MKKVAILIFAFSVFSCASKAPQEESFNEFETGASDSEAPALSKKKVEGAKPLPVSTNATPTKDPGSALDEAIASQSDERIQKQATLVLLQSPQDVKALNALAILNYKRGRFTASKYFLSRAIQAQPSAELYNNLGVLHLALSEKKEAIQAFRQAVNLNPQDPVSASNMGAIYVEQRDFAKAAVALDVAYQRGYRDPRTLNNYAIALTGQGRPQQAQALYEKALKDQGNNKDILFNYAILLIDTLKNFKQGSEILNRLKFVGTSSEQRLRIKDLENKVKIGLQ